MKIESNFKMIVISMLLLLLGAFLGACSGFLMYNSKLIPTWKNHQISQFQGANEIHQVDIKYTGDDPTEDILYILTEDGKIYANTLFNDDWAEIESIGEDAFEWPLCATEWNNHPPIKSGVVDSAGIRFERPLSTISRCYVLYDDGTLQVWTRSINVSSAWVTIFVGGLLGLIVGLVMSVFIWIKA